MDDEDLNFGGSYENPPEPPPQFELPEEDDTLPFGAQPTAGQGFPGGMDNPFAKYVDQSTQPFAQPEPAASDNPFAKYVQKPDTTKAEGPWTSALRAGAHNILPGAVGVAAGVLAAPTAPATFGVGPIAAGAGAFLGARELQDKALSYLGFDDSHQMAVNAKANPKSVIAGEVASSLPYFGVGAATRGARALGAGAGAILEGGSQAIQGEFDPLRLGAAVGSGALLATPTRATGAIERAVGGTMGRVTGRPDLWPDRTSPPGPPETPPEQFGPEYQYDPYGRGPEPQGPRYQYDPYKETPSAPPPSPEPYGPKYQYDPYPYPYPEPPREPQGPKYQYDPYAEPSGTETHGSPGATSSAGTAEDQIRPNVAGERPDIGNVDSRAERSARTYPKQERPVESDEALDRMVADILNPPTRYGAQLDREFPPIPQPGEPPRPFTPEQLRGLSTEPPAAARAAPPEQPAPPPSPRDALPPQQAGLFDAAKATIPDLPDNVAADIARIAGGPRTAEQLARVRAKDLGLEVPSREQALFDTIKKVRPALPDQDAWEIARAAGGPQTAVQMAKERFERVGGRNPMPAEAPEPAPAAPRPPTEVYPEGLSTRQREMFDAALDAIPVLPPDEAAKIARISGGPRTAERMARERARQMGLEAPTREAELADIALKSNPRLTAQEAQEIGNIAGGPQTARQMAREKIRGFLEDERGGGRLPGMGEPELKRDVVTRGRSGRPIKTERMKLGQEERILEAGAQRVAEGVPEGTPQPPLMQPMQRGATTPEEPVGLRGAARTVGQKAKGIADEIRGALAPQTLGEKAREAADWIRGAYGRSTQAHEQIMNSVAPHRKTINAMIESEKQSMVDWMQGNKPYWKPSAKEKAAAEAVRNGFDQWAETIGKLDRAKQIEWLENYLPGMYKNGDQAKEFFSTWSKGAGGAGSLKQKTFPSYAEARAAGLEPYTNDPVEMLSLYSEKMRNFVGRQEAMERGLRAGTFIKRFDRPQVVGAAGSPEPLIKRPVPPGYVESKTAPGVYMPQEVAKVWDNFHDVGLKKYTNAYEAVRNLNSAWTSLELSLNGYHAFTMANEAIISDVAMALEKLAGGNFTGAATTLAKAPAAFVGRARLGSKLQEAYLTGDTSNPAIKSLIDAGFRPIGRSHAQDARLGQKTFIDSLQDLPGQIKQGLKEGHQDWLDTKGDPLAKVMYPFRQAGRVIATVSHPLFNTYIPKLKSGAALSQMQHWMEMNPGKVGTREMEVAARKIVDSIDNRFGEMVTDHLFMNKTIQDMAVAGMRSFSWAIGSGKEIGGGAYSGLRAVSAGIRERSLSRMNVLDPANKNYDPRVAYAIAMPMTIAATSAMYQYLLGSHDAPASWHDLYAPRTGGKYKGTPEHMLMPGYHKDVYGWIAHPGTEAYNKLGGVWQTAIETARGRETPALGGLPFVRPKATFLESMTDRMGYVLSKMGPIGVKALIKGQEKGSEIPAPLTAAGFHPTGKAISAPQQTQRAIDRNYEREYKQRLRRIQREEAARR
ncbi:MAG TPA: hypothetical protein VF077_05345 [Nitrospiraceae bacterium]